MKRGESTRWGGTRDLEDNGKGLGLQRLGQDLVLMIARPSVLGRLCVWGMREGGSASVIVQAVGWHLDARGRGGGVYSP